MKKKKSHNTHLNNIKEKIKQLITEKNNNIPSYQDKKEKHKRFTHNNIQNINIKNNNMNLQIFTNETNQRQLTMTKKNITMGVEDFTNNKINGLVNIDDNKKNKKTKINMKDGIIHGEVNQLMADGSNSIINYVNGVKDGKMKIFNKKNQHTMEGLFKNGKLQNKITSKTPNTWQTFKIQKNGQIKKPPVQTLKIPFLLLQTIINSIKRLVLTTIYTIKNTILTPYHLILRIYHKIKNIIDKIFNKIKKK